MSTADPYRHPSAGDPPKWSLPLLRKRRGKIMKTLKPHYLSVEVLSGGAYDTVFSRLYDLLPDTEVPDDDPSVVGRKKALDRLLREYYGEVLDEPLADRIARELSGNFDSIRLGKRYGRWKPEDPPVWGLIRVVDVERVPYEGARYWVKFRVAAGPATGFSFERILSKAQVKRRLREVGIPKYKYDLPPEMLHDMFFTAWIGVGMDRVIMQETTPTASTENHNRKLMEGRMGPCTGGWARLGERCTPMCSFGLDACPLAWHRDTYKLKSARPCRNYERIGGRIVHHEGLMNKNGRGICIRCIYAGLTLEKIRERERREDP